MERCCAEGCHEEARHFTVKRIGYCDLHWYLGKDPRITEKEAFNAD